MQQTFDMSEIIGLYKEDARRMVSTMQADVVRWAEVVSGGDARLELRKLAHQLRGSGRTYGFNQVTRVSKAIENLMIRLEKNRIAADERLRASVARKVNLLESVFRS